MNVFSKIVFIALLLCIDFFGASSSEKQTPEEMVKAMFEEIKNVKTEEESYESIGKRADKPRISKALCGKDNEEVAVAVCKYFAKMLSTESVRSILLAPDCEIEVAKTIEKTNKSEVHVVIKSSSQNGQKKSVSVVVIMGKNQKIRDIKIEDLSILPALYTQVNAYVKAKRNKTLKQIGDKERPKAVVEAITSLQEKTDNDETREPEKAKQKEQPKA